MVTAAPVREMADALLPVDWNLTRSRITALDAERGKDWQKAPFPRFPPANSV